MEASAGTRSGKTGADNLQDCPKNERTASKKAMVAIFGIGYDEVGCFEHLRFPMTTQSLDLLYANFNVLSKLEVETF